MTRFLIPIVIALMGWATQVYAQGPLFVPAPDSPVIVGLGSGQVILADISGDGQPDLLTRHLQHRLVTVQLGDGQGRFVSTPASPISFDYTPGDTELGDVNHDGFPDLGVLRSDRDQVDIFLGNGQGGFNRGAGSPFGTSTSVYTRTKPGLHLMDINEDGNPDFVTTNGRQSTITTFLGDGQGKFVSGPVTSLDAGQDYYSVAFGDMDGDGHLDAVIATSEIGSGRLVTQRGDGTGVFKDAAGPPLIMPAEPRLAALAHMNGDQYLDAVISHSSNSLDILLNHGNGTFAPVPASSYLLETQAFAVVAADVNQDQKVDLVAATVNDQSPPFNSSITVLLGADGGYIPAPGSPFEAEPGTYNLTVGDINQDGRLDVAASSFESSAVTVLLQLP